MTKKNLVELQMEELEHIKGGDVLKDVSDWFNGLVSGVKRLFGGK